MKRFQKRKTWLTIADTARQLSIMFDEPVSEADVLQLGLEGQLTLSVQLVNQAMARMGQIFPRDEAPKMRMPPINGRGIEEIVDGTAINDHEVVHFPHDQKVVTIADIWDLPMIGAETLYVQDHYQRLTGGPKVTLVDLDGAFVKSHDGRGYQLREPLDDKSYFPGELPHDSVLVVRTAHLRAFEQSVLNEQDAPSSAAAGQQPMSKKLATLIQGHNKFWANADPDDRSTHPTNDMVATWFEDQGFSTTLADKSTTIIRPEWAPTGRKPEE